ncbi:MAG TPA: imidazoleglycerol-phosphate dehydratase HisB [Gaiellales bacterium]|nr:imidazoleglycerol-phosphate dehydratase HisB [Gaiellales bacterium]
MSGLVRADLAALEPYRWQEGWERHVPEGTPVVRLDQNTQGRPPAWYAGAAARLAAIGVNGYPDSRYTALREAAAAYAGFPPEQIVVTAGADEALMLCALLALSPGDRAYARTPAYAVYGSVTRLAGASLDDEPDGAQLTWVCSPHNPTGEDAPGDVPAPGGGLVVIDQAYLEFGGTDLSGLVRERDDVVVVRTLSKGFALAGIRVGYLIAPPPLARALEAVRPPGSISSLSNALALRALSDLETMRADVAATVRERERLAAALAAAGWRVHPSCTNFLLADTGEDSTAWALRLLGAGIVVRTFDALPTCLRITVGTPADNDLLLRTLGFEPQPEPQDERPRTGTVHRRTRETAIDVEWTLDGSGEAGITTGIGFLDHMLTALAFHSLTDLRLMCAGDLWVDEHHTVEDVAIALGQALDAALGDRAGIVRYGDARAPLDEALCHATVDLGGRGHSAVGLRLTGERIGELPASLIPHFFDSLSRAGRLAIHLEGSGEDDHHVVEAAFKSLALALRRAVAVDEARAGALPSTKGSV